MSFTQLRAWARTVLRGRDARPRPRRPGRPRLEWLEDRLTPDAVSWTGAGDGINWSDARNWSTATRLPGPADDVSINAPGTVVLHASGNDTVHSLQSENAILLSGGMLSLAAGSAIDDTLLLTGGTLSAAGALTVNGLEQTAGTLTGAGSVTIQTQWDWSGGTESGGGHTILQGNANLSSAGFFSTPQLSGRTVDNDGTATLLSGSTLGFDTGAVWNNQSDGTFVLQGGGSLSGGQFNNAGLLQLPGPQGASISGVFDNTPTGTVDVQAGSLSLGGGGASSGTFDLEGNSVLSFGGTYNLLDGATSIDSGTIVVGSFTGLTVSGSVSLTDLTVSGGTVTLNSGASLDTQNLRLDSGTLTGPGDVAVENDFTWTSGTLGGTGDPVLNGTAEISGGFFASLSGRTVDNHGTATLLPNSGFQFNGGGTWNNHSDGTLVLQSGSSVGNFFADSAVLNNDGLVQKVGPGGASVNVTLNNSASGTVDVEGGTLTLTTGSSSGTFNAAAGAVLNFNNAFTPGYAFLDGASGTGDGAIQVDTFDAVTVSGGVNLQNLTLAGGTVTVNVGGSLTAGNLTLAGGTLTGAGDVTVLGNFNWTSGTLSGTGGTFLEGTASLNGGFFSMLNGRTVNNDGTATFTGSGIDVQNNGVWNNDEGATTVLQGSGVGNFFAGPQAAFNNAGLLQASGTGTVTVSVPLSNAGAGTIDVQAGTTLSLGFFPGPFQTAGTVTVEAGATFLTGNYTQTGGTTTVDGTLTANNTVFLNGGLLTGGGTINGNVTNAAELLPGDSPGVLTINGNYTQTADGTLDIEIGGPTAGTQYDRLAISGTAALAGTLNVIILNGFVPTPGTAFQVLTFHSHSGDFDAESGLDLGNGLSLAPVYNAGDTGLSLVATQSG